MERTLSTSDELSQREQREQQQSPNKSGMVERFIKFFLIKSIQVIIQSRLNKDKVKTEGRLPGDNNELQGQGQGGADWFNLQITDSPDILSSSHPIIARTSGSTSFKIVVEIFLETEGDVRLPLEIWVIEVVRLNNDIQTKDVYAVYNRLGLMIKSLLTVTRVTPAYKIARRRVLNDGFEIKYQIYEQNLEDNILDFEALLGDKFKGVFVGKVPLNSSQPQQQNLTDTPTNLINTPPEPQSSIKISLNYRTKMELINNNRNDSLLLKSDHYSDDSSSLSNKEIKPAFNDDAILSYEIEENNFHDFFSVFKKDKKQEEKEVKTELSSTSDIPLAKEEEVVEQLSLPFLSVNKSENSSSTSEELMLIFNEFNSAPKLFNEGSEDAVNSEEIIKNLEMDLGLYDDFVNKLLTE